MIIFLPLPGLTRNQSIPIRIHGDWVRLEIQDASVTVNWINETLPRVGFVPIWERDMERDATSFLLSLSLCRLSDDNNEWGRGKLKIRATNQRWTHIYSIRDASSLSPLYKLLPGLLLLQTHPIDRSKTSLWFHSAGTRRRLGFLSWLQGSRFQGGFWNIL